MCTVFRLMRGKKKAIEAQYAAWHHTDSCARSIDGAVELYKRGKSVSVRSTAAQGLTQAKWSACARGLQTVRVETGSQSALRASTSSHL